MFISKPNFTGFASRFGKAYEAFGSKAGLMTAGAVAAGLTAPVLFDDGERGYLGTAMLTTPVIGAGFLAGPKLFPATGRAAKSGFRFTQASFSPFFRGNDALKMQELINTGRFNPADLGIGQTFGEHFDAFMLEYLRSEKPNRVPLSGDALTKRQQSIRKYLTDVQQAEQVIARETGNIAQYKTEIESLRGMKIKDHPQVAEVREAIRNLRFMRDRETAKTYLGQLQARKHTVYEEVKTGLKSERQTLWKKVRESQKLISRTQRVMLPDAWPLANAVRFASEKAGLPNPGIADDFSSIHGFVEQNLDNPEFVQRLSSRVRKLRKAAFNPIQSTVSMNRVKRDVQQLNGLSYAEQLTKVEEFARAAGHERLVPLIQRIRENNVLFDSVSLVSENVISGKTGETLSGFQAGFIFYKDKEVLPVGFVDRTNRTVRYGRELSLSGLATRLVTNDDWYTELDQFALESMIEGRGFNEINKHLNEYAPWFPFADERIARGDSIRSGHGVAAGRLKGHRVVLHPFQKFQVGKRLINPSEFTPKEMGEWAAEAVKKGLVVMGASDSATNKGRFFHPLVRKTEIGGVMPTAGQQIFARGVTKEFELAQELPANLRPGVIAEGAMKLFKDASPYGQFKTITGTLAPQSQTVFGSMAAMVRPYVSLTERDEIERWARERGVKGGKGWRKQAREAFRKENPNFGVYLRNRTRQSLSGELAVTQAEKDVHAAAKSRLLAALGGGENAEAAFQRLAESAIGNPLGLQALEKMGGAGETEILFNESVFSGYRMKRLQRLEVAMDQVRAPWEELMATGQLFGKEMVFGAGLDGRDVTALDRTNMLVNAYKDERRNVAVFEVAGLHDLVGESQKTDVAGVKGYARTAKDKLFHTVADLNNTLVDALGSGTKIDPDTVDAIAPGTYFATENKDAVATMMNTAHDIFLRTQAAGWPLEEAGKRYVADLRQYGFKLGDDNFLQYSDALHFSEVFDTDEVRRTHLAEIKDRTLAFLEEVQEDLFADSSLAAKDPVFRGYLENLDRLGDGSFETYLRQQHVVAPATTWATSELNIPQSLRITHDIRSYAYRNNMMGILKEINATQQFTHGDPRISQGVLEYLKKGDFLSPLGEAYTLGESVVNLHTDSGRAGSVFDVSKAENQANRSIKLKHRVNLQVAPGVTAPMDYFPLGGTEAYGWAPNRFFNEAAGQWEWNSESIEHRVSQLSKYEDDPELYAQKVQEAFDEMANIFSGKKNWIRAKSSVKGSAAVLRSTTTSPDDIFDMYISKDMFESYSKKVKDKILAGEQYATVWRHPASTLDAHRIRYNPNIPLGYNQVAEDMAVRIPQRADFDGDYAYLMMHESEEAIADAKRLLAPGSEQWHRFKAAYALRNLEDPANITAEMYQQAVQAANFNDAIGKLTNADEVFNKLKLRWQGNYVGHFSNFLTRVQMASELHSDFRYVPRIGQAFSPILAAFHAIDPTLFQLRQVPIHMAKGKMGVEDAQNLLTRLTNAWSKQSEEGGREFVDLLAGAAKASGESTRLTQEVANLFPLESYYDTKGNLLANSRIGEDKVNLTYSILKGDTETRSLLEKLASSDHDVSDIMASINTRVKTIREALPDGGRGKPQISMGALLEDIKKVENKFASQFSAVGKRGEVGSAKGVSRMLGSINEALSSASKGLKKAFGPAGPLLAAGLGVGALAGMIATPSGDKLKVGSPPSANRWRPENEGVADHVPGEPIPGSMAPSNPLRRLLAPKPEVQTAVVAPMHRSHNVDVQASGPPRDQFRETERAIEGIAAQGNAHVTKNYVGGWRQQSVLRRREKIREEMDRYR
jgi:hypothetical protein